MLRRGTSACLLIVCFAAPAAALDVRVKGVHAPAAAVQATLELRNLVPDRLRHVPNDGGVLYLRIQAELWESRPVWDRLVYPVVVRVFQLARSTSESGVTLTNQDGGETTFKKLPDSVTVTIDLGPADRVDDHDRYYVHAVATLGTIAQRDIDDMGDAVFGRPDEANSLGALARTVFRKMLEIGDYLQSTTGETTGRRTSGAAIRAR
jgi:hypothetical protein